MTVPNSEASRSEPVIAIAYAFLDHLEGQRISK
jgi:hypothetical protein